MTRFARWFLPRLFCLGYTGWVKRDCVAHFWDDDNPDYERFRPTADGASMDDYAWKTTAWSDPGAQHLILPDDDLVIYLTHHPEDQ